MADKAVNIVNRKARFQYEIQETYQAGIMLMGTEIKSIRDNKVSLAESYCYFKKNELYVKNMHIAEYSHGNINNHDPLRERKLLLQKRELNKLQDKLEKGGNNSIIPLRLFINDEGLAKMEIGIGTGKKLHDKRHSIKEKDVKRDLDRNLKL